MEYIDISWEGLLSHDGASDLLSQFKIQHGGDVLFLRELWKQFGEMFNGKKNYANKGESVRLRRIHSLSQTLTNEIRGCSWDALPPNHRESSQMVFSERVLLEQAATANKNKNLLEMPFRGRSGRIPEHLHREYWCAALLPYFKFMGSRADRWSWIANWLALIEVKSKVPETDSLRDWWQRRSIKSLNRYSTVTANGRLRVRRLDIGRPGIGIGLRHLTLSLAAYRYPLWKRWSESKDISKFKKYDHIVKREMPFFKAIIVPGFVGDRDTSSLTQTAARKAL